VERDYKKNVASVKKLASDSYIVSMEMSESVCVVCVCVYAKNLRHGNGCFINGRGEVCVFVCVNHEFILYV
jgi:hypothetical protein